MTHNVTLIDVMESHPIQTTLFLKNAMPLVSKSVM